MGRTHPPGSARPAAGDVPGPALLWVPSGEGTAAEGREQGKDDKGWGLPERWGDPQRGGAAEDNRGREVSSPSRVRRRGGCLRSSIF